MSTPKLICLTPIKNEAWILERFLKCASTWADHIIVADQASDDGSREIARRFPKVILVENTATTYDERSRQRLLINEARKIPGPRVLMALDADECLTANFRSSPEWKSIQEAAPGTVIRFSWPEIRMGKCGLESYICPWRVPVGFVDNGDEHEGPAIHSTRIPTPPDAPSLLPTQIQLMHYCLADRERFKSRIRWYQCWETINSGKRPLALYRQYHKALTVPDARFSPILEEWILGYTDLGIDMTSILRQGHYRWDTEILDLMTRHGASAFRKLAIWNFDWRALAERLQPGVDSDRFADPRSFSEKRVHRWLARTQVHFTHHAVPGPITRLRVALIERLLRLAGW